MNILVKSVQDIMYEIPNEVLVKAFMTYGNDYTNRATSLEETILAKVIRPRVVPDANIARGQHMQISLANVKPKVTEDYRVIYEIPERLIPGKTILSVMNVSYVPYNGSMNAFGFSYGGVGPLYSQDVMTATQQMVEASSSVPAVSTARVELIGENTVLIEDTQRYNSTYSISCYVTDNDFLSKINPRNFEYFSTLCAYAVKSYIYRTLRIRMDRAYIEGGSELGQFKAVVEEFADAEENYKTFLRTKWAKVAFIDSDRHRRFVKAQLPVGL